MAFVETLACIYIGTEAPCKDKMPPGRHDNKPKGRTAPMLENVYNTHILEFAGNIPRLGRLQDPDASASAHSRLCGSTVRVEIKMEGGKITDFAHEVKACALGQASSSIMARNVIGATAKDIRRAGAQMRAMLKDGGPPPDGRWADLKWLEPVRDFKARHASTLLTFDAVEEAVAKIEAAPAKETAAAAP